jgi:hypothetical protein
MGAGPSHLPLKVCPTPFSPKFVACHAY